MTDDIHITDVSTADNREWLITGDYVQPEKAKQGVFQAHATNRSVVAMCKGALTMNLPVRVSWREGRSKGFRDLLLVSVL